jgi:hypothetical protein
VRWLQDILNLRLHVSGRPVWNINADNIKNKLAQLFSDFDLQQRLIIDGRKYVEQNNPSDKVAEDILKNLANPGPPDYSV